VTVKIFPPGPLYYTNFDKIAWDRQEPKTEEEDDCIHSEDTVQEIR